MSDRPGYLIIVTHAAQAGVELFSAHYTDGAARLVLARLERLLVPTGSRAHLIEVPQTEGVADVGELPPLAVPAVKAVAVAALAQTTPPAEKPAPFRRMSREEFAAETQSMEMDGGPVKDTPDPKYSGAFS
jgi:hypothetical protein